jgi:O-antigen ligase
MSKTDKKINLIFGVYLFLAIFSLSLQQKTIGQEAIRTLHYPGIFLLFGGLFIVVIQYFSNFPRLRVPSNYFVVFILLFFYYYILLQTFSMPIRALKDVLIGSTVDILLFFLLLIYILKRNISTDEFSIFLAKFFITFSLISSIFGLMLFFGLIEGPVGSFPLFQNPSFDKRLHGLLGDPTHFGSVMGLGIICANFLMYLNKQKKYLVVIFYLMIILIMSGSRNSIVSLAFSLFVILIFRVTLRKLLTLSVILSVIVLFLCIYYSNFESEVSIYIRTVLHIETFTRISIWSRVIDIFSDGSIFQILFGHGSGYLRGFYRSAHSTYLEYLVDYGLVFIMLFLIYTSWLFWILFRFLQRDPNHPSALFAAGLLAYSLVFSMFLVTIFTSFFHFINFVFLCAILVISLLKSRLSRDRKMKLRLISEKRIKTHSL